MSIFRELNKEGCFYILQTDYPEMVTKFDAFWGHKEFKDYLKHIMIGGEIEYTDCVVSTLFRLNVIHDTEYPEYAQQSIPFVCK